MAWDRKGIRLDGYVRVECRFDPDPHTGVHAKLRDGVGHDPDSRANLRRHRWVTAPSGLLLFACIALPGYRECGRNIAMHDQPYTAATCVVGLLAAAGAMAFAWRGGERAIAIMTLVISALATGLLTFGALAVDGLLIGIKLALVTAICLTTGSVLWVIETTRRDVTRALYVIVPIALLLLALIALNSTWKPPPERTPSFKLHSH